MDLQKRSLRIGAAAIVCAVVIRLLAGGQLQNAVAAVQIPEGLASFLLYLETGRVVRPTEPTQPPETVPPAPTLPSATTPTPDLPVFTAGDAAYLELTNYSSCQPDPESLLTAPLDWQTQTPAVLILHTHTCECYTQSSGEAYALSGDYRTLDDRYNMVSIGRQLARVLEEGGVRVIHATDTHDYPSYNGSYENARRTIARYLKEDPQIRLVLDLHRDAADDGYGGQLDTQATVDGTPSAQLMIVVGTNGSGLSHPDWQKNAALGAKLQVTLEKRYPGLCRPMQLRSQRFNQDLSPGALLIEVGAAGNSHPEAMKAAEALGRAILELMGRV